MATEEQGEHASTGVFRRRLTEAALGFVLANFGKVVSFAGGILAAYLAIWSQIGAAKQAARDAAATATDLRRDVAELRGEISRLVTQRELEAATERIETLEDRLNYARDQAGTAPVAHHRRERTP